MKQYIKRGDELTCDGTTYPARLRPKIDAEVAAGDAVIVAYVEPPLTREQIDALRKVTYQQRSDPLYMQWQYDQTPAAEQLWRDEVAAIKAEYPWPVEVAP